MNKLKEKIVYEGKTFQIIKKPIKSKKRIFELEIARRSPGVRLIIVKKNKILLTREFRPGLNKYDYRLPGGKVFDTLKEYKQSISKKQNLLGAAKRAAEKECAEETGLIPKNVNLFQISKAGLTVEWDLFYFIADDFTKNGKGQQLEPDEIIYPEWKTFGQVKEFCLNGKISEDRSVGVLLKFLFKKRVH